MDNEEYDLKQLKKNYKKLQEKHSLPSFEELNEDFNIEKIAQFETDILIREIRKFVVDKITGYTRFIEAIFQPVNVPIYMFSMIKCLNLEEKGKLSKIYTKLVDIELDVLEIDIKFNEEKEVKFLKKSFKIWNNLKEDLLNTICFIRENWEVNSSPDNKSYFN